MSFKLPLWGLVIWTKPHICTIWDRQARMNRRRIVRKDHIERVRIRKNLRICQHRLHRVKFRVNLRVNKLVGHCITEETKTFYFPFCFRQGKKFDNLCTPSQQESLPSRDGHRRATPAKRTICFCKYKLSLEYQHRSLSNAPHGIARNHGFWQCCAVVDPRVIALQPVVYCLAAVELLLVLAHKLGHLPDLLPPHVLPQELQPGHVFELGVQPANAKGGKFRAMIGLPWLLIHQMVLIDTIKRKSECFTLHWRGDGQGWRGRA